MTDTIPCDASVSCEISLPLQARCPVRDETDRYTVIISWHTQGETLEKHGVIDTVDSYSGRELPQETLAENIHDDLESAGIRDLSVILLDNTHGLKVKSQ